LKEIKLAKNENDSQSKLEEKIDNMNNKHGQYINKV
jgi:hypothetical protein